MKQTPKSDDLADYGRFGIAALLPGMRRIREVIDEEISRLEFLITEAENSRVAAEPVVSSAQRKKDQPPAVALDKEMTRDEAAEYLGVSVKAFNTAKGRAHIKPVRRIGRVAYFKASDIERMKKRYEKGGAHAPRPSRSELSMQERRRLTGWGNMTAQERSAEMRRRQEIAKQNKEAKAAAA